MTSDGPEGTDGPAKTPVAPPPGGDGFVIPDLPDVTGGDRGNPPPGAEHPDEAIARQGELALPPPSGTGGETAAPPTPASEAKERDDAGAPHAAPAGLVPQPVPETAPARSAADTGQDEPPAAEPCADPAEAAEARKEPEAGPGGDPSDWG